MKNWKNVVVTPAMPVIDVIKTIDAGRYQIALVLDKAGHLLGTVTDGDIRRGILRGITMDQPAEKVMRKDPTVASSGDDRETILGVMKKKMIHQIPVLDAKGVVVGLELMDELLQTEERDNWVVIMAGGLGKRLSPLTESVPKSLIQVGKKPILETILENFIEYGFRNFYFAVNYKDEMIKSYFGNGAQWKVRIEYLSEDKRLGTAGALSLLPEGFKKTFFVMNGDLLTKINFSQLLSFHRESEVAATMCVREYDFQVPFGVVRLEDNFIRNIDEKPVHRFFVNAGIYVLEPSVLDSIPQKEFFDMPQLFEKLIAGKTKTAAFPIREYWLDIGRIDDLERAHREFPKVFAPDAPSDLPRQGGQK
jgi:dTDP-glucose pyrophosphorylase